MIDTDSIHHDTFDEVTTATVSGAGVDFDLDVLTVPIGETPISRRIVDSGTYTCSTQSCCTTNSCH